MGTVNGGGAVPQTELRIAALEQRVAQLEELVGRLCGVLAVNGSGSKATLKAARIELEADIEVKIKGVLVEIRASSELTLKSSNTAKLEGTGAVEVKSSGPAKVKGSVLYLNDGTKFLARQTDPVAMVGNAGCILGGNPAILA